MQCTAVAAIGALALLATAPAQALVRDDVITSVQDPGLVVLTLNDFPFTVDAIGGSVSLRADDPFCDASPTQPCSYVLNSLRIFLDDFYWSGHDHHYDQSYIVVNGPLVVEDKGNGILIPAHTPAEYVWTGYVNDDNTYTRSKAEGELAENGLLIVMNPTSQNMTITGHYEGSYQGNTFEAYFNVHTETPFRNMPPKANAGPDQTICPSQLAHLSAAGSTDPNNDIMEYRWSENGRSFALGAEVDVPLAPGTHTLTLTVSDTFGGQGKDTVVVTVVEDTTPPTFTAFPPATVQISTCSEPDIGFAQAQAQDNCPGRVDITYDKHTFQVGTTIVMWTAKDLAGNTTTWQQTIQTGPPVFTSPPPSQVTVTACDNQKQKPDLGTASATDACGGALTVSNGGVTNNAPSTFPFGDTSVTWTATDASGSSVPFVQTVSVGAVNLGTEHQISTVSNNACLRVTQYPSSWAPDLHAIRIQPQANGSGFPIPFTYTNCGTTSGTGTLPGPWQEAVTQPVSASCPTLIKLGGNGAGNLALTWWGNG